MVNTEVARTTIKTEYFGSLTERMNKYREDVLNKKPYIDAERAVLATRAYERYKEQPNVLKRAYMLKEILENMSIYIEEESMIAGNQASSNKDAPIFPEYTLEFVLNELDLFEKRDGDVFYITEETKEQLRSIAPFWENNNLRARAGALLPEEVSVYMETGFFGMEGKMNSGDAHLAVNYQKLLQFGLRGFEERARKAKVALDLTDPASIDKYHFYDSIFIVIDAIKVYAKRFVALAKSLAENANPKRKKELLEIADICSRVPYEPATTFYVDEIAKYPNTRYGRGPIGGIRYSGTSSISANVGQGRGTLATPDGRNAGTPLAEGCSPSHNMDQHGPTSVLKSVSKLPTDEIVGGVLLNQKVNPQTLAKEEDKLKLIALLRTFFNRLHGYHIQYNVVSRETLIDAQKHPEKHRDLIVRVAGYSAFFNVLSKATQDDIIGRTEHTL